MTRKPKNRHAPGRATTPVDPTLLQRLEEAGEALERIERGEAPTAAELAGAPHLDWWCVALGQPFQVLRGIVTGHPRLRDGAYIETSPLLWIAPDETAARTVSRWYRLGQPLTAAPRLRQ